MRSRLLATYLSLTFLVLLALEVPLALSYAMGEYHHLAIRQLNDTATLSSYIQPALERGDRGALQAALRRHQAETGSAAVVLSTDGSELADAGAPVRLSGRQEARRLSAALSGRRSDSLDYPYNLEARDLVVVEPVISGDRQLGVLATSVTTGGLRATVLSRWAILIAAGALAMLAAALAAVPFTRWILRPVERLDETVQALADGHQDARVPVDDGPPEIRTVARAFNVMADRLRDVSDAQRSFVADASHQLRNPLTALRLRVENLETATLGTPAAHAAQAASAEAERLSSILDQLLALARAEGASSTPVPVDIARLLQERADAWEVAAARRGVRLVVVADAVAASAGPGLAEQMVDNLLDNALRFSPIGGVVTLKASRCAAAVRIDVVDQGPGMDDAELGRALDRFWRSPSAEQTDGSGLGLSIVARLAESAGGSLMLARSVPHGLAASVTLPLLRLRDPAIWLPDDAGADGAGAPVRV